MSAPIIAPSVLACDFANLEREIKMLNESEADWIHVDIMDGVFVPNISMGIPVVEAIKRHAKKPLDVHLMIVAPENHVEAFQRAGASSISVHVEVCRNLHRNVQQIKSLGCNVVCVMSVNPGFGGQKFIDHTYKKVTQLKKMIQQSGSSAKIEIDGGVSLENAKALIDAGADVLVAGNFVFSAADPSAVIRALKSVR
jgi:ribulose-phosphate 3-epimerase